MKTFGWISTTAAVAVLAAVVANSDWAKDEISKGAGSFGDLQLFGTGNNVVDRSVAGMKRHAIQLGQDFHTWNEGEICRGEVVKAHRFNQQTNNDLVVVNDCAPPIKRAVYVPPPAPAPVPAPAPKRTYTPTYPPTRVPQRAERYDDGGYGDEPCTCDEQEPRPRVDKSTYDNPDGYGPDYYLEANRY